MAQRDMAGEAGMGWLHLDQTLGVAAHRLGLAVMAGAIVWAAQLLWRQKR